jgi:hypothetical protein
MRFGSLAFTVNGVVLNVHTGLELTKFSGKTGYWCGVHFWRLNLHVFERAYVALLVAQHWLHSILNARCFYSINTRASWCFGLGCSQPLDQHDVHVAGMFICMPGCWHAVPSLVLQEGVLLGWQLAFCIECHAECLTLWQSVGVTSSYIQSLPISKSK